MDALIKAAAAGKAATDNKDASKLPDEVSKKGEEFKITNTEGWSKLENIYGTSQEVIDTLDKKVNEALRQQEYQYLQAYNIYVKKKEKELRSLIEKLDKNNEGNNVKEKRITTLEKAIDGLRQEASAQEEKITALKDDIKVLSEKHRLETEEKEFFHKQALDAKRKNKLLKVAISRIQLDQDNGIQSIGVTPAELKDDPDKDKEGPDNTFLTGTNIEGKPETTDDAFVESIENSQALVEQNLMKDPNYARKFGSSVASGSTSMRPSHKRTKSQGSTMGGPSRYKNIPTQNVKFEQFVDLLMDSKMSKEDMKAELVQYAQQLETNYNNTISELKLRNERTKTQLRKEKSKHVNDVIEKGDLETLFVDCVEEVRRQVIKRRLKAEIIGRKKIGKFDHASDEAKEFEESLLKLANLAKDRVKFSEFTAQDRNNLLDLFVNNEKTLLRIYEVLFPKKAGQPAMNNNSLK